MAKKTVYWLVAVTGMALAGGAAWWWQTKPQAPAAGAAAVVGGPGGAPTAGPGGAAGSGGAPGAGGAAGPGGAPGGRPGGGTPNVEVAQVKTQKIVDDAQAVGTVRSRQSVVLRPEVSGRVTQIAFADGARVRRGQVLVRLDDTLQRAELSQAQAQLSIARANLKRNEELVAQNFVAQRVLDEGRAAVQVAEAQVQLAEARLARMRVVAPFDGTVGIAAVNLGEYVKDGADLVNLEDTSALVVDFRLPERFQARVSVGQPVQVQLDALPGQTFTAKIQALEPLVEENARAVVARAQMSAPKGANLRPGLFARVTVVFNVNEAALVVPEEAIVPQAGKQFVIRLKKEGEGEQAKQLSQRVEVKLGLRRGGQVQILEGVAEGDTVVVAGQQRLQRDGTAVRVVDLTRGPGGPGGAGRPGGGGPGAAPGAAGGAPGSAAPMAGAPAAPANAKP